MIQPPPRDSLRLGCTDIPTNRLVGPSAVFLESKLLFLSVTSYITLRSSRIPQITYSPTHTFVIHPSLVNICRSNGAVPLSESSQELSQNCPQNGLIGNSTCLY